MSPMAITIVILVLMVIAFCSGKFPLGICGVFTSIALLVTGVLTTGEASAGFSNSNVVIMFCMMIVSAGLMRTHLIEHIIGLIQKVGGGSATSIIVGFGLILILMSQFMNAFVAVACMLPFILGMCEDMKISPSKVMFPLGTISLAFIAMFPIGFGAGLFAQMNGYLEAFGGEPLFSMFTLTWARLPVGILVTLYAMFILPKYCPDQPSVATQATQSREIAKSNLSSTKEILAYVISIGTIAAMMTSSLHGFDAATCSAVGAFLMVATNILDMKTAVASVSWDTIFMFAGILPLATALTKTGASDVVANAIQTVLGGTTNPWIINAVFGITAFIMTQFLSNTAMVSVFTPLALVITTNLGMNPVGIMGIIYIGSTASFLTPMATPGVPILMAAGGYDFKDVLKLGFAPALLSIGAGIVWCTLMFPAY